MWLNMDANTIWKPRWLVRAVVADAVVTAETDTEAASSNAAEAAREMIDLRTAMMRVLNRFPEAAIAVMEMFREIRHQKANPEWAHEGG